MRGHEVSLISCITQPFFPLPVLTATRGVQVLMRGLFQNRFRRSSHGRRRSLAGSPVTSLEKLEPRLALAGDVSRPLLEAATRLYMDPSMHGPQPVVMGKSQVVGHDVKSFVISRVPAGSVVEKLDTATNTWVDVSTKPTSSNPRELLRLLKNRLIQQGDSLRWTPKAGTASSVQQAFEMIGWDDGSELPGFLRKCPVLCRISWQHPQMLKKSL